eukprot:5573374-Pyramimonas_sp.AAC.1
MGSINQCKLSQNNKCESSLDHAILSYPVQSQGLVCRTKQPGLVRRAERPAGAHHGPIRYRTHGYILTTDQSDAGRA